MMGFEAVLGWAAIGLAASLAGMVWTFRRGALGVAINALVAMVGAVLVPVISFIVLPPSGGADRHEAPGRLVLAAVGALAALAIAHGVWTWRAHQTRAAATR
jgi:uncharacterized sodium:solute symporter family permease YidK